MNSTARTATSTIRPSRLTRIGVLGALGVLLAGLPACGMSATLGSSTETTNPVPSQTPMPLPVCTGRRPAPPRISEAPAVQEKPVVGDIEVACQGPAVMAIKFQLLKNPGQTEEAAVDSGIAVSTDQQYVARSTVPAAGIAGPPCEPGARYLIRAGAVGAGDQRIDFPNGTDSDAVTLC